MIKYVALLAAIFAATNVNADDIVTNRIALPPGGSGDPHFRTWNGDKFDYHGECDLVLAKNPAFDNGKGLHVHIRTTRVGYYSYISEIAVKIGEDVLVFENDVNTYTINGKVVEKPVEGKDEAMFGGYVVRRHKRAISIRLDDANKARIDLYNRKTGFPAVHVDGGSTDIFQGFTGLLGEWGTGSKLARDGETVMGLDEDGLTATEYALEWQVRDDEPMLFPEARYPQYPVQCIPPKKQLFGRLGLSHMKAKAEEACANWNEAEKDDCIFDVIATRNFEVAAEGDIEQLDE